MWQRESGLYPSQWDISVMQIRPFEMCRFEFVDLFMKICHVIILVVVAVNCLIRAGQLYYCKFRYSVAMDRYTCRGGAPGQVGSY